MKKLFSLLAFVGLLAACTPGAAPPILTEVGDAGYHPGRVVWYNLASPNPDASRVFYETVFGWNTVPYGDDKKKIWVFRDGDQPVALMALYDSDNNSGEWIGAISVPDVAEATDIAKSQGARIMRKPDQIENQGTISFVQDPQGAHFSLIKLANGDPDVEVAPTNHFLGLELWSNDPSQSQSFYKSVVGYEAASTQQGSIDYTVFKMGDMNCAGMLQNPSTAVRSHWLPYIRVADVNATLAKAKTAGAKVLIEPNASIRNGSVAVILDPTGAPLALQVYNP